MSNIQKLNHPTSGIASAMSCGYRNVSREGYSVTRYHYYPGEFVEIQKTIQSFYASCMPFLLNIWTGIGPVFV